MSSAGPNDSSASVREPLDEINHSGDGAAQNQQQQDNYSGYDQLEFSIAILVRRGKRTLRKVRRWCVSGHGWKTVA